MVKLEAASSLNKQDNVNLLNHMHKKFEINQTKIKGGCQSGRKAVAHKSKSDLLLLSEVPTSMTKSSPGIGPVMWSRMFGVQIVVRK